MQKKDLHPGKVYGYSSARRSELQPVLFLSSDLYTETTQHYEDGTRELRVVRSHPRATMSSSYGSTNGYLVLWVERDYYARDDYPTAAKQFEEVQKYTGKVAEIMASLPELTRTNGKFMVGDMLHTGIVNSRDIHGPWDDVSAARNAADAKSAAFDEKGDAWAEGRNHRLHRCRRGLEAITGETVNLHEAVYRNSVPHSGEDGRYRSEGSITLNLSQVEAIIAALAERPIGG